ncbi:DHA2 family efflux MFS transporter permease subunit [Streptomyces avicenniae]|uniref:DHA2 family efflux MFS transporter permease subunit n=1 Tax=Streptomyces avicenniae TaxID=500153 RepID=UPI000B0EDA30|nr:DHA2 family efflux MFS transporter permease subunit [Streptomyces avicenniae]
MAGHAPPPSGTAPSRALIVWTLILTGAATFMAALDNLVVTTALPVIRDDLGGGLDDLEWIVNGYTLPFACLLLPAAALGDRFGRRRIFSYGIALFTVASAVAALAESTDLLIAARALQGVGAAGIFPLSLTLITAVVPAERRGAALGIWGAINGLAVAGGPLVGGAITDNLSWHWIFWLNVPIGIALLPLVLTRLRESRAPGVTRLDIPGAVLASTGLFGIVLAVVRGSEHGWTSGTVLTGFVLGGLLMIAFVLWELRTDAPMLPMRLFRSRAFSAVNATNLLMYAGMFGSIFLLTQFLQLIQGYTPTEAGVRMLPWTAMPLLISPLAGAFSDRIGGRPIVAGGLLAMAGGLGWLAVLAEPEVSYASQVPGFVLCGIGMALFFAAIGEMVMASVEPREQGIASGVSNAMRELGGALGVSVLASVFAAQGGYETPQRFTDGLVPAVWGGVVALLAATVAVLIAPGRRSRATRAPGAPDAPAERVPVAA